MDHNATRAGTTRIVFLDYLRVLACLMVIATHCCEPFYIGADGIWQCASESDRIWVSLIDSAMRGAVPLFIMTSSYLLLPLKDDNTTSSNGVSSGCSSPLPYGRASTPSGLS